MDLISLYVGLVDGGVLIKHVANNLMKLSLSLSS